MRESRIKIVLKPTIEQFEMLLTRPDVKIFMDSGESTQGTSGKITVIGFLPGAIIDDIKSYKLY